MGYTCDIMIEVLVGDLWKNTGLTKYKTQDVIDDTTEIHPIKYLK